MRQQLGQRHGLPGGELVVRQLPGPQVVVDVAVQREAAARDERQGRGCRNRFADGCGLEARVGTSPPPGGDVGHAPRAEPLEPPVMENGDANRRDAQLAHPVGEPGCALDPLDPGLDRLLPRERRGGNRDRQDGCEEAASWHHSAIIRGPFRPPFSALPTHASQRRA
jgi:hypothetical protein